ncbi:UDP-N-acetylmuramoyl-L-alanine--D-glutamate ligase [Catellatospora sp. KI3]|uniref:UDP-N-acetylmuramoyl-L-alanine--D-glutamate ligase n=1 Tax=Catellatospora sp. KI3 TaxID=3041620 RepID=UPI00248256F6|nr:UDP-N-acetylmuramoyl-L-alanine--D-glutamate ligase [Catellatospora sp. KI3]MDI1464865.1 UDP-N-acetylmuramoyl-L-alanine--D-glutamate ligase [Catellatospora sp. KI3]
MYEGRSVLVAGARMAGAACATALAGLGAEVTVVDRAASADTERLAAAGIGVVIGEPDPAGLLSGVDDLVVSPGFPPHHPLAVAAAAKGIEVYSEPELAWRLRGPDAPRWLAVTGTNGKTTTVTMLASMLAAAGLRTAAVGNIGRPLVDCQHGGPGGYDVLAVELSSFQLHWSSTLAPHGGALLNLADDHLDWHGDFDHYAGAKTAVWRSAAAGGTAVGNLDDPRVRRLLEGLHASGAAGPLIGFTLDVPPRGCVGVVEDVLVDRTGEGDARELATLADIRPVGAHNVANALAAAALALSAGVPHEAIQRGLAGYVPEPHRNATVATVGGVRWVDDSKATNPHAAQASLVSYERIVWVAGGQLKGVDIDELTAQVAPRLAGAVLLGVDRAQVAAALARHAPHLPVVDVARTDDGAMEDVVAAAARLASPGDTVLLAPAAASLDMFTSYAARGDAFARAVHTLPTT